MTAIQLKQLREQMQLTQEGAAKQLHCCISTIQKWEQGINKITDLTATAIRATLKKEK